MLNGLVTAVLWFGQIAELCTDKQLQWNIGEMQTQHSCRQVARVRCRHSW